jgi:MHS family proline/betaine transporter-like MFS transporter
LTRRAARKGVRLDLLALAVFGVALEGYDNTLFGLFALPIGLTFFPRQDPSTSLMLSVAAFGVGYVARPVGGLVLGAYADRAGRPAAVALTVSLMAASTGVIGFLPGYAAWGLIAPATVVVARLVQGFAAGGAAAGAIAYLTEAASPRRRGLVSSWQQASQVGALILTSAIGYGLFRATGAAGGAPVWAWRGPFVLALLLGPVGLLIHRRLPQSGPTAARTTAPREAGLAELGHALLSNRGAISVGMGLAVLWSSSVFILLFYMPTYAQHELHIPASDAFLSSAVSSAVLFCWCPIMGALSDRIGRKPVLLCAAALIALGAPGLFLYLQSHRTFAGLLLAQALLAAPIGGYLGTLPATLAELYPSHARTTSIAVADNLVALAFGACGPMIVLWLTGVFHSGLAPAAYVSAAAAVSALSLVVMTDRTGAPLRN